MKRHLFLLLVVLLPMIGYALSEVNGVYQIGTAEDFIAFAELVNGGKADARAILTADIDKGMDGTMIGRDGLDYQGVFDGNGHTITINLFSDGSQGTALFRNVGVRGLIQNLKVQGTITSDQKLAAGIAVWSSGIIRGCYVDVTVNSSFAGDATHGGIVAVSSRGTVIENCLAKFVVKGATTQNCGGLVGWSNHPMNAANNLVITDGSTLDLGNNGSNNISRNAGCIRKVDLETYNQDIYANRPNGASSNNYVTNQWGDNAGTSVVAYDDLADGRICYQLNTDQSKINWVQNIGTDPFPVPAAFGTGQVYASGPTDCDGKSEGDLTFSNEGTAQATAHTFDKYGICSACGCFNFQGLEFSPEDNAYLLKSAADIDLAEGWNRIGDGFKVDMKMANDIKYIAEKNHYIFNTSNWVYGSFNGDGHQLTIVMDIDDSNASFIPQFSGTFENVIMHGSITTAGQYAGSITSHTRYSSVIVRNVFSDITINTTHPGDNSSGGLFGVVETKTQVENSIYAGNINGNPESTECLAGFCGWSSAQTYYTNCAFIGTLNGAIGDSKTLSRNPANITCTNVYFANSYGYEDEAKATLIENAGDIGSGALAYALNGNKQGGENFYQVIGVDPEPLPIPKEGGKVYWIGDSNYANEPNPNLTFIEFADANVKAICVANWDTNGDGELSEAEAAAVTSLGDVFKGNTLITSFNELKYFTGLTSINYQAFYDCTGLTSVAIPNSVTTIGWWAFNGCTSLTSIIIPNSVTSIGSHAFQGCSGLTSITIPNSVTSIEESAFYGCSSLTAVMIPSSVTSIGYGAFSGCSSLTSITIPESVTSIGNYTFNGCTSLTSISIPNNVTSIGGYAFYNCSNLTSVIIPNNVTSIGGYAFYNCSNLTSVIIPNSVTSIGESAFEKCSGLTNVTIGSGVKSIGEHAFYHCFGLVSITIGSGVTNIGESAFRECYNLTSVKISDLSAWCNISFVSIESNPLLYAQKLFLNDAEIRNLVIPEGVTSIGNSAFIECSGLNSVTIPNSVADIGDYAFYNCSGLSSVIIPKNVTYIANNTFGGCSGLTSITIPDRVTRIGDNAFSRCSSLTSINIPESVTIIGQLAFGDCSSLTSFTIPNSVTSIGYRTFTGCSGLTSITIGNSVTSIGKEAFSSCIGLTSITIPQSVARIENEAFQYCHNLTFVKMENAVPADIYINTFPNRSNAVLLVPEGSVATYQASEYWKDFRKIVDYIANGDVNVDEDVNVVDVVDIARYVVGTPANTFVELLADINTDGAVNLGDAVVLVNNIAGDQNFVKVWSAPDRITANDALSLTEKNGNLSLNLENERCYTAFQFDLFVPENTDVTQMLLNAERKQGHQLLYNLLYNKVEDGHYRVAALSTSNNEFIGHDGELLSIALNELSGDEVSIRDIHFFDAMGHDYLFEDIEGAITTSLTPALSKGEGDIYDLQGRKREKIQRGINIVGDKKIIY